jgi:hypothetical protein
MLHFTSDKTADELASSWRNAQQETIEELLAKIKELEKQIEIKDKIILHLRNKSYLLIEEDNAPDTYVKKSIIEGFGLYASKEFKFGDLIIDYNLFPENWYKMKYVDLSEEQIRKNWYVMIDNQNCITSDKYSKFSYINHSRNPNCFWNVDKRIISADRDIQKDEELFIDYRLEPRPTRTNFPKWI